MPDQRFFTRSGPHSLASIAAKTGCELADPADGDFLVEDIAPLDKAMGADISFLDNKKFREKFEATTAGACIVHPSMRDLAPKSARLLLSETPYKAYALCAQLFYGEQRPAPGRADTALLHPSAQVGANASIGDYVIIKAGAKIGANAWIESYAVIGENVEIGDNARIGAHASVSHALIGDHVRLYPGVRISQDGFGFAIDPTGFVKVPQLGRVIIEGNTEIGANTSIDRGAMDDTVIGRGTWIDNLVQIGHNVKIGKGCVIVAQVGISGSTELGDYVILAGQVGVAGHSKIGAGARIAAQSGIIRDVGPKEEIMGYPGLPIKQFFRQTSLLNRLIKQKNSNNDRSEKELP